MSKLIFLIIVIYLSISFINFSSAQDIYKAQQYFNAKQYEKAAIEFEKCIPVYKIMYGDNDISNYSILLLLTAASYHKAEDAKKAESYYLQCNEVYRNAKATSEPLYATSCNNLAELYRSIGDYQKALPLFIESKNMLEKTKGKESPDYATSCNNLALLYSLMGDYQRALSLFIEAKRIFEKANGKENPDYAQSCNNLAQLYKSMGDYHKALSLFLEAKQIREMTLGKEHIDYAQSCNSLAELYRSIGDYSKALPLYIDAKQILEKTKGKENPDYATLCNNLALLYHTMGDYKRALLLYIEAKAIYEKALGKEHPSYAASCNNLAGLYQSIGNYQRALPLYIEAKVIYEKNLGKEHPDYAQSCNNLTELYGLMGDYKKALTNCAEAKQICEKTLGKENLNYAQSCNSMAILYQLMGDYKKALPLYIESKQIRENALGKGHPVYAQSCNNLAKLYESMGDCQKALPLYLETKNIYEKALGKEHPDYATSCNNLANLYYLMGYYPKTKLIIYEANQNLNRQIRQNFSFLTEKEKEQFIKTITDYFDIYLSFSMCYKNQNPDFVGLNYNNELAHKGMILQSTIEMKKAILNSSKPELVAINDKLTDIKRMLSKLYTIPINQRFLNADSLENEAYNIEKQLINGAQNLPGLENFTGFNVQKSWTDVQKSLKKDEAAIEFISFQYRSKQDWTDSIMYCALIVRKGYKHPEMIPLFEEKQLSELVSKYKEASKIDYNWVTGLYLDKQLYNLIWQPIEIFLNGISTIYYSPSGLLNKIAISAIPVNEKERLSDKYRFSVLGSTGELTGTRNKISNLKSAAIFGGLKYDADSLEIKQAVEKAEYETGLVTMGGKNNERWGYLKSSKEETNAINQLLKGKNILVKTYTDDLATEESFKNLSNQSPEIIHISTHGFYNPLLKKDQRRKLEQLNDFTSRDVYDLSENPLIRTGLIFAGANYAWTGNPPIPDRDDGILTAYEISNMNLFNTKLVVTSACETALGDVRGGEGIFGLQRGFKMAGVDNIVNTLWQVSAEHTKEFMIKFYTKILDGQTIHDAFYKTQAETKIKYPNPYFWAAFVLIE